MEMTMRFHPRAHTTYAGHFLSSTIWLFKTVGMMAVVSIGLITSLFLSVGVIAALFTFIFGGSF